MTILRLFCRCLLLGSANDSRPPVAAACKHYDLL